jgi:DNA-binding SARP family transcriptional activator
MALSASASITCEHSPMAKLVVRLLGGFHVELDGKAVYKFESDKCRALLAYLIVEAGRPHRRETLSGLLWPDRPDTMARANLRQALSALRRALTVTVAPKDAAPDFLFVTPTDVQFNTASDYALDVADLEEFGRQSGVRHDVAPAGARREQLLPEALCADFLAGFALPDSETFQAWVLDRQEHYHRLTLDILDEQAAYFEGTGDYGKAVAAARLQLRMEPWLEEAHRRCMRDLTLGGRRDEALHQYE